MKTITVDQLLDAGRQVVHSWGAGECEMHRLGLASDGAVSWRYRVGAAPLHGDRLRSPHPRSEVVG